MSNSDLNTTYAVLILAAGMLIGFTMMTGAFFSRYAGTRLSAAVVACCALAVWTAAELNNLTGVLVAVGAGLVGAFLFVASLGGERDAS